MWGTYPNYFGFQNANVKDIQTHYVARPIEAVKALGAKKIAVIGNSTGNAATFAEQNADSVNKTQGVKLVYKTTDIPPGTTEFGAVVDQIKQSGADTVYTTMAVADGIALVNALKQAGVVPKIIVFPGGYSPSVLNIPAFDNAYFSLEFAPFETTPSRTASRSSRSGWRRRLRAPARPDHRSRMALGQHVDRGTQGCGRGVPHSQGLHQQPAPGEGLHRRRMVPAD